MRVLEFAALALFAAFMIAVAPGIIAKAHMNLEHMEESR